MNRSGNSSDADAIQSILHDLMRHILQLQSKRNVDSVPVHDEPVKLEPRRSQDNRQRSLSRQIRDSVADAAGVRERLASSLNVVASHSSLGAHTLHRESTKLDSLIADVRSNIPQVSFGSTNSVNIMETSSRQNGDS